MHTQLICIQINHGKIIPTVFKIEDPVGLIRGRVIGYVFQPKGEDKHSDIIFSEDFLPGMEAPDILVCGP